MDVFEDKVGTEYRGNHIGEAETTLFTLFIQKAIDGRYDECRQICGLLERLSLI